MIFDKHTAVERPSNRSCNHRTVDGPGSLAKSYCRCTPRFHLLAVSCGRRWTWRRWRPASSWAAGCCDVAASTTRTPACRRRRHLAVGPTISDHRQQLASSRCCLPISLTTAGSHAHIANWQRVHVRNTLSRVERWIRWGKAPDGRHMCTSAMSDISLVIQCIRILILTVHWHWILITDLHCKKSRIDSYSGLWIKIK